MVAFHKDFRVSPTIAAESVSRNKIPETLEPGPGSLSIHLEIPLAEEIVIGCRFVRRNAKTEQDLHRRKFQ